DTNTVNGVAVVQGLHTNYVTCSGSTYYGNTGLVQNGVFYVKSKHRVGAIPDGTSNTVFASESLVVPDSTPANDLRGRYCNSWYGNNNFAALNLPNTTVADTVGYQGISTVRSPSTLIPTSGTGSTNVAVYARSAHSGGVNALMGDGSIRFVSNNI